MEDKSDQNPSEIPLNAGRVDAVIGKYEKTSDESLAKTDKLSQNQIDITETRANAVKDWTNTTVSNMREENKLGGLGGLFGKKQRQEKEQSAEAGITAADSAMDESQKNMREALGQARHAAEEIAANKLGGPIETSSKMVEALKQQDVVKIYTEFDYPVENADNLPTKEMFDNLREVVYRSKFSKRIREQEDDVRNAEEYLELYPVDTRNKESLERRKGFLAILKKEAELKSAETVLDITPFIEVATEICDKEGIPVSERLIEKAVNEGMRITEGVTGSESGNAWNFVKEKKGRVSANDVGYYAIGAFQLDRFFKNRPNIEGRNRLPYVIAYAAGALANGAPAGMPHHLRNWLSETIPGAGADGVREGKKWVLKQTESHARGYGYFLADEKERNQFDEGQTYEQGWVGVVTEANEIATKIYDKLGEKRRFNAQNRYNTSGLFSGRPQFGVPVLRNLEENR